MAGHEIVVIDRTTATAYRTFPPFRRTLYVGGFAAVPLGLILATVTLGPYEPGEVIGLGLCGLLSGVLAVLAALTPSETRIVIDAATREIGLFRRYLWQTEEIARVIPFSRVRSVGIVKESGADGTRYCAVMRLSGRPSMVSLWSTYPLDRTKIKLSVLTELTGFPRVDEL